MKIRGEIHWDIKYIVYVALFLFSTACFTQILAFPGAMEMGTDTIGGHGGTVLLIHCQIILPMAWLFVR